MAKMAKESFCDEEGSFTSSDGASKIVYYVWLPPDALSAKGVVQLVHGMREHSGRYVDFARYLNANGYIVCQNDHLGHGRTAAGTFGYMGERDGDMHMVDDVYELTKIMKKKYPNKKYFMFGHSMGSFVARKYCVNYSDDLTAVVFSGTCGGGATYSSLLMLVRFLTTIKGGRYSAGWIDTLNEKINTKRFKPISTGKEWLSRDENVWKAFSEDELCKHEFSLGGYKDLLSLIRNVSAKDWAKSVRTSLPIFLLSGLDDPVGDYGRGVLKVYQRLVNAGNKYVSIKLYEGGRHEMLNEINKQEVYADVLFFLDNDGLETIKQ